MLHRLQFVNNVTIFYQLVVARTSWSEENNKRYFPLRIKISKDHDGGSGCGSVLERSPPTPEIPSLNPVIGKLISNICLLSTVLKGRK